MRSVSRFSVSFLIPMEQRFTSATVQRIWELNGCPLKTDNSGKPINGYMWTIGDCQDSFGMSKVPKPITNDAWEFNPEKDLIKGIDYMNDEESKMTIQKLIRKNWAQSSTNFHKRPTDLQMKLAKASPHKYAKSAPLKRAPKRKPKKHIEFDETKFVIIGRNIKQ